MTFLLISCFLLPKLIIKSYKIVISHIQTQSKSSIELEGLSFCYPKNRDDIPNRPYSFLLSKAENNYLGYLR